MNEGHKERNKLLDTMVYDSYERLGYFPAGTLQKFIVFFNGKNIFFDEVEQLVKAIEELDLFDPLLQSINIEFQFHEGDDIL